MAPSSYLGQVLISERMPGVSVTNEQIENSLGLIGLVFYYTIREGMRGNEGQVEDVWSTYPKFAYCNTPNESTLGKKSFLFRARQLASIV